VPPLLSAGLLLLLVVRLGLISRVAVRRADALAISIQQQAKLHQELQYRAQHDPLTGLLNRAVLSEAADAVSHSPQPEPVAMLMLDLDQFKDVNDTLGHPVGDELLIQVAERLRHLAPARTLVRLGGDEFAILLLGPEAEHAVDVGERLVGELRAPYQVHGHELHVTTSIGIRKTDPAKPRLSPTEMLRDADQALYAAKAAGKDRVSVFAAPR
jgi:diguanylate cyclase (GGDEF)-like protein